jgi:hypothetical protein
LNNANHCFLHFSDHLRRQEHEQLIEGRSKGNDWRGICCSFASWEKTTMELFAPIDAANNSFVVFSVMDYEIAIKNIQIQGMRCKMEMHARPPSAHRQLSKCVCDGRGRRPPEGMSPQLEQQMAMQVGHRARQVVHL